MISGGQTPRYLAAVPGAGHAPLSDTPDAVVRLVDEAAAAHWAPR